VGQQGEPSELYTIADLSSVWIELAVPLADLDQVEVGQDVLIRDADQRKSGTGRIIFLGPILNEETHSARVIAEADNRTLGWKPGSIVTTDIVVDERDVELHVPRAALQTVDGKRVVFVRSAEGFAPRQVQVGRSNAQAVEITAGLVSGDQIAVSNTFLLKAELAKADSAQAN
jgi:cobalt-zinc-cadmium efflux system membrane fusion protein